MPELDYDEILYGNPAKKLRAKHAELCRNFSEDLAKDYSRLYMEQPLSFLLENSRYIFSEPMYGLSYYKEKVSDVRTCLEFAEDYPEELEKVEAFVEEYGPKMSPEQKSNYEELVTLLQEKVEGSNSIRIMLAYEDVHPNATVSVNPVLFFTHTPEYFLKEDASEKDMHDIMERCGELATLCSTNCEDSYEWKTIFESMVTARMLTRDSVYQEAIQHTPRIFRTLVNSLANASIADKIDSIYTTTEKDALFREYGTPEFAVDTIFDVYESSCTLYKDEFEHTKEKIDDLVGSSYHFLNELIALEYANTDNPNAALVGFQDLFSESTTISEAWKEISEKASEYEEATDASILTESELGEPSQTVRDTAGYIQEEEPARKKSKPPVSDSTARNIQSKWMDREAKFMKRRAKAKETGEEIKGAVKAVGAIPASIKKDIDTTIQEWDNADEERRRKYMTKPGFRKKIFRNLKLALMYGAAASWSILMVPVTALCRHYSKSKDRRVRNQLVRELDTEIEICKTKIEDASSMGHNQEKYKLMRIKSKLEEQKLRVLSNSKYI